MKNNSIGCQSGSSLLTLLIIITFMSLLCLNIWRMTIIAFDISLKKQQYEQQIQLINGYMQWAVDMGKNNFDLLYNDIIAKKDGLQFFMPIIGLRENLYQLNLSYKKHTDETIAIRLVLSNKAVESFASSCLLTKHSRDAAPTFEISAWNCVG